MAQIVSFAQYTTCSPPIQLNMAAKQGKTLSVRSEPVPSNFYTDPRAEQHYESKIHETPTSGLTETSSRN